ncbi:MAG: SpoIID/LytB domain-containing protein [Candidatus Gastranaerophilaceae bacterium]
MKKLGIIVFFICFIVFATPAYAIKVGLYTNVESVRLGASTPATIINAQTNRTIYTLDSMRNYEFKAYKNDNILLRIGSQYYKLNTNEVTINPQEDGFVSSKNRWYRGIFILKNRNGLLTLINKLDIESYLQGVVPAEMPSSWEYEAHKAQAIAARSYALANLGKRASYGYDLKDTPEDQAYNGASAETEKTNQAVSDSYGIVLIYDLKIIPAFYSASAGGHTVGAGDVWNRDLPYIRAVPSYDDNIKKNGHGVGMSQHGANNLAKQGYNAYQILQYFYKDIRFARINQAYYK